jgi:hypothetical protein
MVFSSNPLSVIFGGFLTRSVCDVQNGALVVLDGATPLAAALEAQHDEAHRKV